MFNGTLVKLIKFPAENLTIFHGTLVFRGTPVENHCAKQSSHGVNQPGVLVAGNIFVAPGDWPVQERATVKQRAERMVEF